MKTLPTSFLILGLFIALVAAGFLVFESGLVSQKKYGKVLLKGAEFKVEIVDTPVKRSRGLSGRDNLTENEGMLFLFPSADHQSFWMKGMVIPIDILWIRGDRAVGFKENVQPEPGVRTANLKRYVSPEPVERVLEVRSGTVERLGIQVGDEIIVEY